MGNQNNKKAKKPMRQIIVLKGEFPKAKFSRKQAEEAVKSVAQEQKLARKRASRQAKFDKKKKQEE
jgi:hypothetical protein